MKPKNLILITAMLVSAVSGFAQIEVEGIYYIFSETTAEVTAHPSSGYIGDIVIPDIVTYNENNYNVIRIGHLAFNKCTYLISVDIPNSVLSIGEESFAECISLTSITIPNSVTNIGGSAFLGCTALTLIDVESENTNYSSDNGILFNKDKTTLICYPAGKTEKNYTIPNSVTSIENNAFFACKIISIDIPNGITSIGIATFEYCYSLTSVTIPNSVTSIGSYAFAECRSLTSIDIPNGVTSIGEFAFFHSGLTSINIPDGITSIEGATFGGCTSLVSVVIPSNVTRIVWYTFSGCIALTSIINFNPVPVAIDPDVFEWMDQSACTLKVPASSVADYKNAEVWKEFNIEGIGEGIEPVEMSAVKVFPSPTNGKVTITLSSSSAGRLGGVKVFDITGRLVLEMNHIDNNEIQIDLSNYVSGVYFLKVDDQTIKVVKK